MPNSNDSSYWDRIEREHAELRAALEELEAAHMDAVRALNALGEPAPARLGLAAEKARAVLAKVKP